MKEVKRYLVSYMNGVIEEDGSPRSPHDSEPMVLAKDFDSIVKELEGKLKVAVDVVTKISVLASMEGGDWAERVASETLDQIEGK